VSEEHTALHKAIHGYLRSAAYRRQGKKEPNRQLSSVSRVDKLGGITEFTVTLRADNGMELRQFVYRLLPDGDWE
jgi:predicted ribonuclease toxin of YeeF-YezG toxin-antitoxin module